MTVLNLIAQNNIKTASIKIGICAKSFRRRLQRSVGNDAHISESKIGKEKTTLDFPEDKKI